LRRSNDFAGDIGGEAIKEAISITVQSTRYYEESNRAYMLLFLTGYFPNPLTVP
jgi:hypothetical protein